MQPTPPSRSSLDPRPEDQGILSLDNVRLDLPLAGVGSRVLAMSFDMLLSSMLMMLVVSTALAVSTVTGGLDGWLFAAISLTLFLVQWGYFAIFEIALAGQTPGKMLVGLRTVSHVGGQPSKGAFVTRNFLRSFDLVFGLPMMALDRQYRRFGDLIASTLVVHDRPRPGLRLGAVPPSWSAREVALAENFLTRTEHMETHVALDLSSRLLDWLRRTEPDFVRDLPEGSSLEQLRHVLQPEAE